VPGEAASTPVRVITPPAAETHLHRRSVSRRPRRPRRRRRRLGHTSLSSNAGTSAVAAINTGAASTASVLPEDDERDELISEPGGSLAPATPPAAVIPRGVEAGVPVGAATAAGAMAMTTATEAAGSVGAPTSGNTVTRAMAAPHAKAGADVTRALGCRGESRRASTVGGTGMLLAAAVDGAFVDCHVGAHEIDEEGAATTALQQASTRENLVAGRVAAEKEEETVVVDAEDSVREGEAAGEAVEEVGEEEEGEEEDFGEEEFSAEEEAEEEEECLGNEEEAAERAEAATAPPGTTRITPLSGRGGGSPEGESPHGAGGPSSSVSGFKDGPPPRCASPALTAASAPAVAATGWTARSVTPPHTYSGNCNGGGGGELLAGPTGDIPRAVLPIMLDAPLSPPMPPPPAGLSAPVAIPRTVVADAAGGGAAMAEWSSAESLAPLAASSAPSECACPFGAAPAYTPPPPPSRSAGPPPTPPPPSSLARLADTAASSSSQSPTLTTSTPPPSASLPVRLSHAAEPPLNAAVPFMPPLTPLELRAPALADAVSAGVPTSFLQTQPVDPCEPSPTATPAAPATGSPAPLLHSPTRQAVVASTTAQPVAPPPPPGPTVRQIPRRAAPLRHARRRSRASASASASASPPRNRALPPQPPPPPTLAAPAGPNTLSGSVVRPTAVPTSAWAGIHRLTRRPPADPDLFGHALVQAPAVPGAGLGLAVGELWRGGRFIVDRAFLWALACGASSPEPPARAGATAALTVAEVGAQIWAVGGGGTGPSHPPPPATVPLTAPALPRDSTALPLVTLSGATHISQHNSRIGAAEDVIAGGVSTSSSSAPQVPASLRIGGS